MSLGSKRCLFVNTTLESSDWGQKGSSEQIKNEDEEDFTGNQEEDLVLRLQLLFVMQPRSVKTSKFAFVRYSSYNVLQTRKLFIILTSSQQ